jgi:predicted TPR repeat methyltransferase
MGHFRILYLDARNHKYQVYFTIVCTTSQAPSTNSNKSASVCVSEFLYLLETLRFSINWVGQNQNITEGFYDHSNEPTDSKYNSKRFTLLPHHRFAHGKSRVTEFVLRKLVTFSPQN